MTAAQPSVVIAHPSSDLYGSDRVMLETVAAMVDSDWSVHVVLPGPGPLVEEVRARGGEVTFAPSPVLRKAALRPRGFAHLVAAGATGVVPGLRLLRSTDARVVYVSTLTIPLWIYLARLLGRPVICHVHESERSVPIGVRRVLAFPLLSVDALIVNSAFSRNVLIDSFSALGPKSEVIYNAVPGPPSVSPPRDRLDGSVRLLFVGRLAPRKGPQVAIRLAAQLRANGLAVTLDLVGSAFEGYEWFELDLRNLVADLGMSDAVSFHGFHDDVWPFLSDCDLVLVPSQGDEPFGNTAVEAVLAARPVIVSASSGLDEAVLGYECAQKVPANALEDWSAAALAVHANWAGFRERAIRDARVAADRHRPARYRQAVSERLSGLAGRGNAVAGRTSSAGPVTVAMLTFRRPDDLLEAIPAVLQQLSETHDATAGLLIIDNDPAGSAADIVNAIHDQRVRYVHEPRPGIAAARNRALIEVPDDGLLIFIDDDERPAEGWLRSLLDTHRRFACAAVVGAVVSEFDEDPDAWVRAGRFFDRRRLPTGTKVSVAATNNLLLDMSRVRPLGLFFDDRFGQSGGSDTLFSRQLAASGEDLIWCDEAVVVDRVPAARVTRRWVLQRAFRSGNSWTRTSLALTGAPRDRLAVRLKSVEIGTVRLIGGLARVVAGSVSNSMAMRARGVRTMARGAGMVAGVTGYVFSEYGPRRTPPAAAPAHQVP
ncbi:glycosyltransferase [Nakamurella sp. GG22]